MTRRYFQGFTNDAVNTGWSFDTTQDWSMFAWVYIAASGSGSGDVFFMSDGTGVPTQMTYLGYSRNVANDGPALRFICSDGTARVMDRRQSCNLGQWYNVAMVHDASAGTVTAYVDGVQVEQATSVTQTQTYTYCEFGDFGGGNDVEIAQVKTWQGYALTVSELADEIAYWTPQHGTSFVEAWWQFDNADQLTDSSGNGHTVVNVSSGGGSPGPGLQTVPGQLNPTPPAVQPVAAVGGAVSSGTAVVRARYRVQAAGGAMAGASAWVSTNVAPAGGGASSFGGRSRKRRGRR